MGAGDKLFNSWLLWGKMVVSTGEYTDPLSPLQLWGAAVGIADWGGALPWHRLPCCGLRSGC